jgi:hypothetical protein
MTSTVSATLTGELAYSLSKYITTHNLGLSLPNDLYRSRMDFNSASIAPLLEHFHLNLSEEDLDALLAHLDPNRSGRVDYPAFFKCKRPTVLYVKPN